MRIDSKWELLEEGMDLRSGSGMCVEESVKCLKYGCE